KAILHGGPDGLKMGMLYDLLHDLLQEYTLAQYHLPAREFSINWNVVKTHQKEPWLEKREDLKGRNEKLSLTIEVHYYAQYGDISEKFLRMRSEAAEEITLSFGPA